MSRRIDEIEADVARARERLEKTLQRIEHKLSASGMVDDALASLRRTRHGDVVDRAMGALRDNPVPVLAVMAGIGWLIGRAGSGERDAAREARARERAFRREAAAASKHASKEAASNSSRRDAFSPGRRAPDAEPDTSPGGPVPPDVSPQPRR